MSVNLTVSEENEVGLLVAGEKACWVPRSFSWVDNKLCEDLWLLYVCENLYVVVLCPYYQP